MIKSSKRMIKSSKSSLMVKYALFIFATKCMEEHGGVDTYIVL